MNAQLGWETAVAANTRLAAENAQLRAENERLKAENERLSSVMAVDLLATGNDKLTN